MDGEAESAPARARTLEDVARLAGVSRNTVSLAVRMSPRVKPATRERVLEVVRATGYRPNFAARALAGRRAMTVGLARYMSTRLQGDAYYDALIRGLRRSLEAVGYDLLLIAPSRMTDHFDLVAPIVSGRVDGIIVAGMHTDRHAVIEAYNRGAALVHIGRRDFGVPVPMVMADEIEGTRWALEHLRQHQHHRVAFVGEDLDFEPTVARIRAYRELSESKGAIEDDMLVTGVEHGGPDRVRETVRLLLDRGMTAAISTRDSLAVALVRGLKELGVQVPEQFAIIAYDNHDWAPFVEPALTCVAPPRYDMGVAAGEMILKQIDRQALGPFPVLAPQKVVRRSCGCAWSPLDERRTFDVVPPEECGHHVT